MPEPWILFAQTLEHQQLVEHVDEIRFREPVLITACEIGGSRGASASSSFPLIGDSFSLQLFARAPGEARFKALCPPLTPSPNDSSSTLFETEVHVTDHVVLRGVYSSLRLVVYGNPVQELELNSLVNDPLHCSSDSSSSEKLKLLQSTQAPELVDLVCKLAPRVELLSSTRSALITSATALVRGYGEHRDEIIAPLSQEAELAEAENTSKRQTLELLLTLAEAGLRFNHSEETLVAALAAIKLLCVDTSTCSDFVLADGIQLLIRVLQSLSVSLPVAKSFALQALELCSRHSSACEAIIGLKLSSGYGTILTTLLQAHRQSFSQASFQVLQRVRVSQLVVQLQAEVDYLVADTSFDDSSEKRLRRATKFLNLITNVIHPEASTSLQSQRIKPGVCSEDLLSFKQDPHLFTILQEKHLLSSIESLLAASFLQNESCGKDLLRDLLWSIQGFIVSLLACGYGALLVGAESGAAEIIMSSLAKLQASQEDSPLSLKQARVLVKQKVALHPQETRELLQASLSVMNKFESLPATFDDVEQVLWCLWSLVKISRNQAGRQALQTILHTTEALSVIIKVFELASVARVKDERLAVASHYAAEILYVLVTDSELYSWSFWVPQASKLREVLLGLSDGGGAELGERDGLVSRLLLLMDLAMVLQSKGGVELLRYSIAIAACDELLRSKLRLNDSQVVQLTSCMQLLASICTPSLGSELIGEGAIGVVSSLLEYSTIVLQDEHDQNTKRIIKLAIPALLLLSKLLEKLGLEGLQSRNSKLLTSLVNLHRVISGIVGGASFQSWDEAGVELFAALRLLASNVAHWLAFGWEPALQLRIFSNSSANDPVQTLSMLTLLGDLLPVETTPAHQKTRHISRNFSVEIYLGVIDVPEVNWHTQTPFKESLLQVLAPSISQLADSILRLVSTASATLFSSLTTVMIRVACSSAMQAAIVLQPLLSFIEEFSLVSTPSDVDIFQVDCCISFLTELASHAASKAVILQLKSVRILCCALASCLENQRFNTARWILKFFTRLCLSEAYLSFRDCCEIASSLASSSEVLPLDQNYDAIAEAFESLARLRFGRAAFVATRKNDEASDHLLSRVLMRLHQALEAEHGSCFFLFQLVHSFACGALTLAAAGKSFLGLGALKVLLSSEKANGVLEIMSFIDSRAEDGVSSEDDKQNAYKVKKALEVLQRVFQRPVELAEVFTKVEAIESGVESCSVNESSIQLDHHPTHDIHEQVVGATFEKCKSSFIWQCLSEPATTTPAKRKAGAIGIRKLSKRLRLESKKQADIAPAEADDDDMELELELELEHHHSDDLEGFVSPTTSLREDHHPRTGLVIKLRNSQEPLGDTGIAGAESQLLRVSEARSTPPPGRSGDPLDPQVYRMQQNLQQQLGIQIQQQRFPLQPHHQQPLFNRMQQDHHQTQAPLFPQQHHEFHHRFLTPPPPPPPPPPPLEHEEGLQQMFSSPEAIQDLLRDQTRLVRLLEQHPRLFSLLKEKIKF